jgi:hypothetical protein
MEAVSVTAKTKTPLSEHYHAMITNLSNYDCIEWVRNNLTPEQITIFRSTAFGYLLDIQQFVFPSQLVHNVLFREVKTTGLEDEMWFVIQGKCYFSIVYLFVFLFIMYYLFVILIFKCMHFHAGKKIRFSSYEFGLVTGLRFGNVKKPRDATGRIRLRDTYLNGQNMTLKVFYERLYAMDRSAMPDEDVVKLSLYYVLERFFIGRDRRRFINTSWLTIVDDLDQFNQYPWGAVSYKATLESMQKALVGRLEGYNKRKIANPAHFQEKYNLGGCPYAIQVIDSTAFQFHYP